MVLPTYTCREKDILAGGSEGRVSAMQSVIDGPFLGRRLQVESGMARCRDEHREGVARKIIIIIIIIIFGALSSHILVSFTKYVGLRVVKINYGNDRGKARKN